MSNRFFQKNTTQFDLSDTGILDVRYFIIYICTYVHAEPLFDVYFLIPMIYNITPSTVAIVYTLQKVAPELYVFLIDVIQVSITMLKAKQRENKRCVSISA